MGNKKNFKKLDELARLLGGDVGATRPVVYAGWAEHDALVGQAGKHIKPKILFPSASAVQFSIRRGWVKRISSLRSTKILRPP